MLLFFIHGVQSRGDQRTNLLKSHGTVPHFASYIYALLLLNFLSPAHTYLPSYHVESPSLEQHDVYSTSRSLFYKPTGERKAPYTSRSPKSSLYRRREHYAVKILGGSETAQHPLSVTTVSAWFHHDPTISSSKKIPVVFYIPAHTFLIYTSLQEVFESSAIPRSIRRGLDLYHFDSLSKEASFVNRIMNQHPDACLDDRFDISISAYTQSALWQTSLEILGMTFHRFGLQLKDAMRCLESKGANFDEGNNQISCPGVIVHGSSGKLRIRQMRTVDEKYLCGSTAISWLAALAHISSVRSVQRVPVFSPQNYIATWTIQSDTPHHHPLWERNLTGYGQLLALGDTGLDFDSCYFRDPEHDVAFYPKMNPDHRKILSYYECIDDDHFHDHGDLRGAHGTHVSGSAVGKASGDGNPSASQYNGIAFDAKLFFHDLTCGVESVLMLPGDMGEYFYPGHQAGATISSNSWGSDRAPTDYTAVDKETDNFYYLHQDYLAVFAAGNQPMSGVLSPAASKNVLTVGAHFNADDEELRERLSYFSASGPTFDKRIKPEVVGPGDPIQSAASDGDPTSNQCTTETKSGTSMATPHISGSLVLIRQYLEEGYYPSGSKGGSPSFSPSGPLMKAIAIHTARSLRNLRPQNVPDEVPSSLQGWGRFQLHNLLYFKDHGNAAHLYLHNREVIRNGETFQACITVRDSDLPAPVRDLRVTMTWFDAATVLEGSKYSQVNDIDLLITETARGNVYYPNNLEHFEEKNNVEQITLENVSPGSYQIFVYGKHVPEEGPYGGQPFSFVATAPGIEVRGGSCTVDASLGTLQCPNQCTNHGECETGNRCKCHHPYMHVDCSLCNALELCSGNGTCDNASLACTCFHPFTGPDCSRCLDGWYGPRCTTQCNCGIHGTCDREAGACVCAASQEDGYWSGETCNSCAYDWGGLNCKDPSSWCDLHGTRVLIEPTGRIQINGSVYENSMTCAWLIRAPHADGKISLSFESFNTETKFDVVSVFDGESVQSPRLGKLSGDLEKTLPSTFRSTGPSLLLTFRSDGYGKGPGFQAYYKISTPCDSATTCHGHGQCQPNHQCLCDEGFDSATSCETLLSPTTGFPSHENHFCWESGMECSGHGQCTDNFRKCSCHPMYVGVRCDHLCPSLDVHASANADVSVPLKEGTTSEPCSAGHGHCRLSDVPTCFCTQSYQGRYCQVPLREQLPQLTSALRSILRPREWDLIFIPVLEDGASLRIYISTVGSQTLKIPDLRFGFWNAPDHVFTAEDSLLWIRTENLHHLDACYEMRGLRYGGQYYLGMYSNHVDQAVHILVERITLPNAFRYHTFSFLNCDAKGAPHKGNIEMFTQPLEKAPNPWWRALFMGENALDTCLRVASFALVLLFLGWLYWNHFARDRRFPYMTVRTGGNPFGITRDAPSHDIEMTGLV